MKSTPWLVREFKSAEWTNREEIERRGLDYSSNFMWICDRELRNLCVFDGTRIRINALNKPHKNTVELEAIDKFRSSAFAGDALIKINGNWIEVDWSFANWLNSLPKNHKYLELEYK